VLHARYTLLLGIQTRHGSLVNTPPPSHEETFLAEVARVRGSGVLGQSGRLLELFGYLAARGPEAEPATQADIAEAVFGQTETMIDDATARVYIHRLRKRLEAFYGSGDDQPYRLTVPAGTYALRLVQAGGEEAKPADDAIVPPPASSPSPVTRRRLAIAGAIGLVLLAGAFLLGRALPAPPRPTNAFWEPFFSSERPLLIVLGDYYIYGEIDPIRPEEGRLIRDFRVDSPADLARMQEQMPDRFGNSEDVGLNYLPFSVAYGLQQVVPILSSTGRNVSVLPASELEPDMLNYFDVIYVGLFSGMHLLEDETFRGSAFDIGESYDELIDTAARNRVYVSEEARSLASPAYYRDYGYIARFRTVSGALVAVVAGARDTGLRGVAPILGSADLPEPLAQEAGADTVEALYQITGQQGANLSVRLLVARERSAGQ